MAHHPPYHITHVYLNEGLRPPVLDTFQQGNYLVFWWHDIALGDVYLQPNTAFTEALFFSELTAAVYPALAHYAQGKLPEQNYWLKLLTGHRQQEWLALAQTILAPHAVHQVPAKAPVTVVVCTRNRAASLDKCLQMLLRLPCRAEEIIVVDNAPSDAQTHELTQKYPAVKYVLEPRPGLDIARNTGIQHASQPLIAFADDDVSVHPHWVYHIWKTLQDETVSATTGLVIAAELKTEAQYIFEKFWSFNRGYKDIRYDQLYFSKTLRKGPPVWNIGAGANMAFRKSVFEQVGLFDEDLDAGAAGCSGDSEMWYRLLANGHTIHYTPRAIAFHEHRGEITGLKKQLFYYMRGHAVAALIQQAQVQRAGYRKHLFWRLPKHYLHMLTVGFPFYRYRYRTLPMEVLGVLSGFLYFLSIKHKHINPQP